MHLAKDQHHNDRLVEAMLPLAYGTDNPSIADLIRDGLISGSNLAEIAISNKSGIDLCPEGIYRDLVDDTDVKTITVQKKHRYRKLKGKRTKEKVYRYAAVVKAAYKKIGLLRVVCYNPFTEAYHYFMIPSSAYYSVKTIEIPFDKENQIPTGRFAEYEVENFEAVCAPLTFRQRIDQLVCNVDTENVTNTIDTIIGIFQEVVNNIELT